MMTNRTTTADRKPTTRSRVTNGSLLLAGIDGRSADARRYRDLVEAFSREIDRGAGLTAAEMTLVRQAAAVALRSELLQSDIVAGRNVDLSQVTRLSNTLTRLVSALKAKGPRPDNGPDLESYLKTKRDAAA